MKLLITGANGLLGRALSRRAAATDAFSIAALGRADLDITDEGAVQRALTAERPDWVINCAAFTRVDDCEAQKDDAIRVNGVGAGHIANAAAAAGARLVHISTDYVFDGRARQPIPHDAPTADPTELSAYGRSKLMGEQRVRAADARAVIVRTAWLYGHGGPCFPAAILRLAREGKLRQVVNDQQGSPTYADDLADGILRLVRADACGTFHFANDGACTWYEFALEILRRARLDIAIKPCTTDEFPRPARRPAYSVLDLAHFEQLTGHRPRHWREALAAYFTAAPG